MMLTKEMYHRIRKAVNSNEGFSLPELMAVILIMTLTGLVVSTGLPAANDTYFKAIDATNAQTLLSTVVEQMRNELSVADKDSVLITTNDSGEFDNVYFISRSNGYHTWILNNVDPNGDYIVSKNEAIYIKQEANKPSIPPQISYRVAVNDDHKNNYKFASATPLPLAPREMMKGTGTINLHSKIKSMTFNGGNHFVVKIEITHGADATHPIAEAEVTIDLFK